MKNKFDDIFSNDPLGLLEISKKETKKESNTSDSKLIKSFQEINQFYEDNDREPRLCEDINEYMLASRLQAIKNNPHKVKILLPFVYFYKKKNPFSMKN